MGKCDLHFNLTARLMNEQCRGALAIRVAIPLHSLSIVNDNGALLAGSFKFVDKSVALRNDPWRSPSR